MKAERSRDGMGSLVTTCREQLIQQGLALHDTLPEKVQSDGTIAMAESSLHVRENGTSTRCMLQAKHFTSTVRMTRDIFTLLDWARINQKQTTGKCN